MGGGIEVFATRNAQAIRKIILHPRVYPQISDDFTDNPEKFEMSLEKLATYLLASDHKGPFGFGAFWPRNWACFEAHFAFLPRAYGADALHAFQGMLAWVFVNTSAKRIVGEIRRDNVLAIRFACRAGCEIYGINRKSLLRDGILHDQVCLGISKP